jgi:hypothetical protein
VEYLGIIPDCGILHFQLLFAAESFKKLQFNKAINPKEQT